MKGIIPQGDGRYAARVDARRRGLTLAEAKAFVSAVRAAAAGARRADDLGPSISSAKTAWLNWSRANGASPSTIKWYAFAIDRALHAIGDLALGEIRVEHVQTLLECWAQDASAGAANRRLRVLRRLARWAARCGRWCVSHEFIDWLHSPVLKEARTAKTAISMQAVADVLRRLPPHLRHALELQVLCSVRPGAITVLEWNAITWPTSCTPGAIAFRAMKNGPAGGVAFKRGSDVERCLLNARDTWESIVGRAPRGGRVHDRVFVTSRGRPWTGSSLCRAVHHHLRNTMHRHVTPYTLRRAVLTWAWTSAGATPSEMRSLAKHKRFATTEGYILGDSNADRLRDQLAATLSGCRNDPASAPDSNPHKIPEIIERDADSRHHSPIRLSPNETGGANA